MSKANYHAIEEEPTGLKGIAKTAKAALKGTLHFYFNEIFGIPCGFAKQKYKKLKAVAQEERQYIDDTRRARVEKGVSGVDEGDCIPFSVAFSGGGIRAAAFQAGVLWQLAEMNKLKDVEYLSAVSGGSYIQTAFATHCMDRNFQPQPGDNINEWYKKVVAQTIVQMQDNCGNFIRDCVKKPGYSGSATCPRWADSFVLIGMVCYTIMVNPVVIVLCLGVPLVNITSHFYGSGLRAAFCADLHDWQFVFQDAVQIDRLTKIAGVFFCIIMASMVMSNCIAKPKPWVDRQKAKPSISWKVQFVRSSFFVGTRGLCIVLAFIAWLYAIPWYERALYENKSGDASKDKLCCEYMTDKLNSCEDPSCKINFDSCPDIFQSESSDHPTWVAWNKLGPNANGVNKEDICHEEERPKPEAKSLLSKASQFLRTIFASGYFWVPIAVGVLGLFFFGVILIPFFGASIAMNVLFVAGPLFAFAASVSSATIPIFGPITGGTNNQTVNYKKFHEISLVCFCLAMIVAPLYESFRNLFHVFYARVLKTNYFKNGINHRLSSLRNYPFAPFIIFTGTCSDYEAPGDTDSIVEVSFSPLHIGSEEIDFVETQHWFRLATGTALSGAGCVDGIGLAMSDLISLRFWLEILNLSWGDFIVFDGHTHAEAASAWIGEKYQDDLIRMLFRFPSMASLFFIFLMFFQGYSGGDCEETRKNYLIGIYTFLTIAVVSLFDFQPFTPLSRFMTMSPFIRQLHQLLKFTFVGELAPPMLYVTDGGVQDCTTVDLLMKRRVERILLVSCGQDPLCKMGNFKDAMQNAQQQNLGGFYVPEDPRKEVWVRLAEFQESIEATHLHIGIRYPEVKNKAGAVIHQVTFGHLLIVKNKLPQQWQFFEGVQEGNEVPIGDWPVLPPITEDEVIKGHRNAPDQEFRNYWKNMKQYELGSGGCCDCCHVNPPLNCCNKWPQGFFGNYLYLSPMFASSLMRLGHQLSKEPIRVISSKRDLREEWELAVSRNQGVPQVCVCNLM